MPCDRVLSGKEVCNQELSDIVARREGAGVLPSSVALAKIAKRWTEAGLLHPAGLAAVVKRLRGSQKLSAKTLSELIRQWRQETQATSTPWSAEKIAGVILYRVGSDLSSPRALVSLVSRWAEAGWLPRDAREVKEVDLQEIVKNWKAGRLVSEETGDLPENQLQEFVQRWAKTGLLDPTPVPPPGEKDRLTSELLEEMVLSWTRDGLLVDPNLPPASEADHPVVSPPADDHENDVPKFREGFGLLTAEEKESLVVEAVLVEALMREEVAKQLVGLALSGGGIRSASFNLGLLQALHQNGLLREVDYLSTVSGGGYIGSHLDSLMLQPDIKLDDHFPLNVGKDGQQKEDVLKLIRSGTYLNRPLLLADRYLIGLILNNVAMLSGLVCFCALLAFLWRVLDGDVPLLKFPLHDWLIYVSAGHILDWNRPFLPGVLLLLAWVASWGLSYWNWIGHWVGHAGRPLLAGGVAGVTAVVAGIAGLSPGLCLLIFLMTLVGLFELWLLSWAFSQWGWGSPWGSSARRTLLAAAGFCLVIGATVWLANPNINIQNPIEGEASQPGNEQHLTGHNDLIIGLFIFLGICLVPFLWPRGLIASGAKPHTHWQHRFIFRVASIAFLCGIPLVVLFFLARHNLSGLATKWDRPLEKSDILDWEVFWAKARNTDPDMSPGKRLLERMGENQPGELGDRLRNPTREKPIQYDGKYNPPPSWDHFREVGNFQDAVIAQANQVLADKNFLVSDDGFLRQCYQRLSEEDQDRARQGGGSLPLGDPLGHKLKKLTGKEKEKLNELAERTVLGLPDAEDRLALNHLLLRAYYPELFRPLQMIVRPLALERDQEWRLNIFLASLFCFLFFAALVNPNTTSPQEYYRKQLAEAYIKPLGGLGHDIPLTRLTEATAKGSPFHLISATLNEIGGHDHTIETTSSFLFSPRFCGSWTTGYRRSESYLQGRLDLATAMAISGAAFSPMRVGNILVAFLMTVLNARLGQWLPHPDPRYAPRRWYKPTILRLLVDLVWNLFRKSEHRQFCFITDGGHNENLGLGQLLRRECVLVIVSDAGQDQTHRCDDFARLYRRARLKGVRFQELAKNDFVCLDPLSLDPENQLCKHHYVLARISYPGPEKRSGLLIYLKPSFTGSEELDLKYHRATHQSFPQDPTTDQLYDEDKVESYRQLGNTIGEKLCVELAGLQIKLTKSLLFKTDDKRQDIVVDIGLITNFNFHREVVEPGEECAPVG